MARYPGFRPSMDVPLPAGARAVARLASKERANAAHNGQAPGDDRSVGLEAASEDACRPQAAGRERPLSGGPFSAAKQPVPERVAVTDGAERAHDDGRGEQGNRAPWTDAAGPHPDDDRNSKTQHGAADAADDDCSAIGRWFWVDFGIVAHRVRPPAGSDESIRPNASSRPGAVVQQCLVWRTSDDNTFAPDAHARAGT